MDNLLSIVTFIPALAALILALFLRGNDEAAARNAKWLAMIATSATFSSLTLTIFSWLIGSYETLPVNSSFSKPPTRCSIPSSPGIAQ